MAASPGIGNTRIKREKTARPAKVFCMNKLHQLSPDFDFGYANVDGDIFLDTSQAANDSVKSSY